MLVWCKEDIIVVVKHLNSQQQTFRAGSKVASKIWHGFCVAFELLKKITSSERGKTDLTNLKAGKAFKTEMSFAFIGHGLVFSEERIRYGISTVHRILLSFSATYFCGFIFSTPTEILKTVKSPAPKMSEEMRVAFFF
jgi:hypothetical protein